MVYSCEEPVDLDIVVQEPQVVVNSNFTPGQPFELTLTKSKYVLSTEEATFINNAEVKIFDAQNRELEQLQLKNVQAPFYYSKKIQPQSGELYKVEINIPDHPTITAEDIVPTPITLDKIKLDTIEVFGDAEDLVYKVEVNVYFDDPIGNQDYYHLSLFNQTIAGDPSERTDGFNESDGSDSDIVLNALTPLESDVDNPAVTFHFDDGGVLFSDEDFDGNKAHLKFYSLLSIKKNKGKVVGELKTVSRNYYLYHTSLSQQIANKDRPFVEPVTVYSNIENGLGIFSGYTLYRDSVSISTK